MFPNPEQHNCLKVETQLATTRELESHQRARLGTELIVSDICWFKLWSKGTHRWSSREQDGQRCMDVQKACKD
jgi:hypothetical protein